MSFRTDKTRGRHPITPKKGIKETDLNIKERGSNDRIVVAIKPNTNVMAGKTYFDSLNDDVKRNVLATVLGIRSEERRVGK